MNRRLSKNAMLLVSMFALLIGPSQIHAADAPSIGGTTWTDGESAKYTFEKGGHFVVSANWPGTTIHPGTWSQTGNAIAYAYRVSAIEPSDYRFRGTLRGNKIVGQKVLKSHLGGHTWPQTLSPVGKWPPRSVKPPVKPLPRIMQVSSISKDVIAQPVTKLNELRLHVERTAEVRDAEALSAAQFQLDKAMVEVATLRARAESLNSRSYKLQAEQGSALRYKQFDKFRSLNARIIAHNRECEVLLADVRAFRAEVLLPLERMARETTRELIRVGFAGAVKGEVWQVDPVTGIKTLLHSGSAMFHNAQIETGPDGQLQVWLLDESVFSVGPDSLMVIDDWEYDPHTNATKMAASLAKGVFRFVTGKIARKKPVDVKVKTPLGKGGIRGTDFITSVESAARMSITVRSGEVDFKFPPHGAVVGHGTSLPPRILRAGDQLIVDRSHLEKGLWEDQRRWDVSVKKFGADEIEGQWRNKFGEPLAPAPAVAPFDATQARQFQKTWARYMGVPVEYTNPVGMKFVLIPPGEFLMGSPVTEKDRGDNESQHRVITTKPYYLSATEVTREQWNSVMGKTPWREKKYVKIGADYPAIYISWDNAVEFCAELSSREDRTYRLPTEAEWEFACRAGTQTAYPFGEDVSKLEKYAWFSENAFHIGEKYAHRVGTKQPNAFRLYDMLGNMMEFCHDWYEPDYYQNSPVVNPSGPATGIDRVYRGGGWAYRGSGSRSANRFGTLPVAQYDSIGFRVALELAD